MAKEKVYKEKYGAKIKFLGGVGVQTNKPSMGGEGVLVFSETTLWLFMGVVHCTEILWDNTVYVRIV